MFSVADTSGEIEPSIAHAAMPLVMVATSSFGTHPFSSTMPRSGLRDGKPDAGAPAERARSGISKSSG